MRMNHSGYNKGIFDNINIIRWEMLYWVGVQVFGEVKKWCTCDENHIVRD